MKKIWLLGLVLILLSSFVVSEVPNSDYDNLLNAGGSLYYSMDTPSGNTTAINDVSYTFNMTKSGTAYQTSTENVINQSYYFDGADDYLEIQNPTPIVTDTQGTISLWFNKR